MKKKNIGLFCFLCVMALALTSCLFESDENGLSSWLSDHGMPDSYKAQVVNVEGIKANSVEAFLDTAPRSADVRAALGAYSNVSHDLVLEIDFTVDTSFAKSLKNADSAQTFLTLFWLNSIYKSKYFPKDSLPYEEDLDLKVSWKLDLNSSRGKKKFLDSLTSISDSAWYESLTDWDDASTGDTVLAISYSRGDTALRVDLPSGLLEELQKMEKNARLQIRLSAPEASHVYRFYGDNTIYTPVLWVYSDDSTGIVAPVSRMANIVSNHEECVECPVLHGGVYDSLVVEIPSEPVMKALQEFYGDEFPLADGNDVRQNVVHAQITMSRDDANGNSEFGHPIQVVVGSFVDSADVVVRRMENYRLNKEQILEVGHQNLVFHDGDSLTLQVTYGARELLNKASDGRPMKFMMRMGYPFMQEKDTTYTDYRTDAGDTVITFLNYFDYARYDFSSIMNGQMTMKLWLASKRRDD
ncbi:MAG: hypothetical protein MJZ26_01225 [Fibrobacter sp.]|nr:hypothetical protein [Fibrobacter sp.]